MTKKQKKVLIRILVSLGLLILVSLLPLKGIWVPICFLIPYFIIGYDILKKAGLGIIHGEVFDENFLMAVATVGALLLGEYREGVAVMLFYQIGELFQSVAVGKSRRNISALMDIRPDYANLEKEDGSLEQVDPDEVEIGTVIVVRPGEKIPIDGIVEEGSSVLNTSALTGESLPRKVEKGAEVISGCINESGLLKVRTTKKFGESTVSKILDLVENSSMKKSRQENFITKFAHYYTPAVCYSALALAILPPVINLLMGNPADFANWISRALTFLVISCPCALVISIPLSFFGGIGGASSRGILIKGSNYLEALSQTGCVVFDKTGTLTKGVFEVTQICPAEGEKPEDLLYYAACAEKYSSHPIAKSLREAQEKSQTQKAEKAQDRTESSALKQDENVEGVPAGSRDVKDWNQAQIGKIEEIGGHGVEAEVDGHKVAAGNAKLMNRLNLTCPEPDQPGTVVHVAIDDKYAGYLLISDVVKEQAADAIQSLKALGVKKTVMLTGDNRQTAERIASLLKIDEVKSELLPDGKVAAMEELLAAKGKKEQLVFVGDGINDAPVLSRADIGIAMGALGSDAAIEAADVVLMDDNPRKIAVAIKGARKCMRIVYENIIFALAVKAICLVLGATGHADMWVAVFADVGVMVIAVLNAVRCLRIDSSEK